MPRPATLPFLPVLLLAWAGVGWAQDTPPADPPPGASAHVVQAGETLESIARLHYGSEGEWRRILEANRDRIADPTRLPVGLTLFVPGREAPAARVTGIRMTGQEVAADPGDRRALLERRPFTPAGVPEPPAERTIFYEDRSLTQAEQLTQVLVRPREEVAPIPSWVGWSAGWTVPPGESPGAWGMVPAFAAGEVGIARTTLFPNDEVRVLLEDGVAVDVGESLLLARLGPELPEVGRVVGPTAVLEVRRVEGAGVVARVSRGLGRPELGDLVFPLRTLRMTPGVYPSDARQVLDGTILAFQEVKVLHQPGDFLFIDRGALDGLLPGHEFVVPVETDQGWEARSAARLQVVRVEDERATLRIRELSHPAALRIGARVRLDRSMAGPGS
jgi:hypothetical protein